jgi:excinuclease ABC subunit B
VGINLLREGLDLPEVSLVAILDADKEGYLRSERSLIQTAGRAARNVSGKVIFYADRITESMQKAIDETNRRRKIQAEFNTEHGIVPTTIVKSVQEVLAATRVADSKPVTYGAQRAELDQKEFRGAWEKMTLDEREVLISRLEQNMMEAAVAMEFEKAAELRDQLLTLQGEEITKRRSMGMNRAREYKGRTR